MGPYTDTCEQVDLCVSEEFIWFDVLDAAFVNYARRDDAGRDQIAKPLCFEWVDFVVERSHAHTPRHERKRFILIRMDVPGSRKHTPSHLNMKMRTPQRRRRRDQPHRFPDHL